MSKDYSYNYEWDKEYCYPESNVLINRLNIKNADELITAEREITSLKIARAKHSPIKGRFDLSHLKSIHRFIFGDIYSWAGKLRHVNVSKGNVFCMSDYLDDYADKLFGNLKKENYLIDTEDDLIPARLAYYLSEINVLHPFREGNGRSQRLFIEYLANVCGYSVDFSSVTDREMIIASADAFCKEYAAMNVMFERIAQQIDDEEQENAIVLFFGKQSNAMKIFKSVKAQQNPENTMTMK